MKNLSILPILLFTFALSAQEPITISHGCNFEGDETETEYYTFETSNEAGKIVKRILDGTDLSPESIVVKEANVKNALATTVDKRRYILYSTAFLEKFKGDAKTKWAAYTVLAHEIGHHLNGHDFSEKDPKERKKMELQADKFAGGVCRTLGATLEEALAGMEAMKLEGETATHPPKSARTAAISNGWKSKDELLASSNTGLRTDTTGGIKPPVLAADACLKCEGQGTVSKKVKCQICGGDGKKWILGKCQQCNGEGRLSNVSCHFCHGLGKYPKAQCKSCDGTGKKPLSSYKCSSCNGSGEIPERPCSSCNSTGKEDCLKCVQTGMVRTGQETCSICKGVGRIDEPEKCKSCKGTGKKKKP